MTDKPAKTSADKNMKGWIGYRPEIKVVDCTIRDGGLMNDHNFETGLVHAVYNALVASGIDYMEVGYKADKKIFSADQYGKWKFSDEDEIRKMIGDNASEIKISVMADAERTDYKAIPNKSESAVDLYRVATYIHQIPTAIEMVKDFTEKGYETGINIMAVSTVQEEEIDAALEVIVQTPVHIVYVVDSFGSMYCEQIQNLIRKYRRYAEPSGKQIGIHAHNNQQLAYSNTITSIIEGANYLDATLDGMGRGAGNCPLELLVGFLHNPKYHIRPILNCLRDHVYPIKDQLNWGYQIPYMITGQLNQHPRTAIQFLKQEDKDDIVKFYDMSIEEDS